MQVVKPEVTSPLPVPSKDSVGLEFMRASVTHAIMTFLLVAALAAPAFGQEQQVQEALRESLRESKFASAFGSLVVVSEESELSTTTYDFDDPSNTRLTSISFPSHWSFAPWGDDAPGLHVESVVGYAKSKEYTQDLYSGTMPGMETEVAADWTTFGGLAGLGLEFQPSETLTISPMLQLGISRIESDADYAGPGAAFTAGFADGVAFNWDSLAVTTGAATRVDWSYPIGEEHALDVVTRYDLRWIETIEADDPAQEFRTRMQLLTLRADVTGPVGIDLLDDDLKWRTFVGYRRFLEGDLYGTKDLYQLGGSFELDITDRLIGSALTFNVALIRGAGFSGWSAGVGFSF